MTPQYQKLHSNCMELGARLFTLTALDAKERLFRRVYTSHPDVYPVSGTKPMDVDGWYELCIAQRKVFVANTAEEFALYFFDHELIVSLGLGSCINIPVHDGKGPVLGTVNILAETGHFVPERLARYLDLVAAATPGLCRQLPASLGQ